MIKKNFFIGIWFCCFSNAQPVPDQGESLFPNIQKINNNLYFAEIPDRQLYLGMERVTEGNIRFWKHYADVQSNPRVVSYLARILAYREKPQIFTSDGSMHFKHVLEDDSIFRNNEVWAAYISSSPKPQVMESLYVVTPDSLNRLDQFLETIEGAQDKGEKLKAYLRSNPYFDIKMFVTVTSSPHALITSHMGISAAAEGIILGDHKGLSLYLHSFAAQVMKRRNPERRYMMNAPVLTVARILATALPQESIFVGDRDQQEKEVIHHEPTALSWSTLVKTHPSILSVEPGTRLGNFFTIYDGPQSDHPWLHVEKGAEDYKWTFTTPFERAGGTWYVLTDLNALAQWGADKIG